MWASSTGTSADFMSPRSLAESGNIPYFTQSAPYENCSIHRWDAQGGFGLSEGQYRFDPASSGVLGAISRLELQVYASGSGSSPSYVGVVGAATWGATSDPTVWENPTTVEEYARFTVTGSSALYNIELPRSAINAFISAREAAGKFALSIHDSIAVDGTVMTDVNDSVVTVQATTPKLIIHTDSGAIALGHNF